MGSMSKDRKREWPQSDRLKSMFEANERARLARAEVTLGEAKEPEPRFPLGLETPERRALVIAAKEIYRRRRIRSKFFSTEMFGEAAWDILLTLYIAAEDQAVNVSSAGYASGVPQTTSLRWIAWLERSGLIERRRHALDARVTFLRLTSPGSLKMDQYLEAVLRI